MPNTNCKNASVIKFPQINGSARANANVSKDPLHELRGDTGDYTTILYFQLICHTTGGFSQSHVHFVDD